MIVASKQWPTYVPAEATSRQILKSACDSARWGKSRSDYLCHLLKRSGVSTLMAEYGPVGVALMPAVEKLGCKFFVHFHGVDASSALHDSKMLTDYKRLFSMADGIFTPSQFISNLLSDAGCPSKNLHVVPCGVDLDDFPQSSRVPQTLIAIGRLVDKKGPLHTIKAFSAVLKDFPAAKLTMIGDGPLLSAARSLIIELGLQGRVEMLGALPHAEVRAHLRSASVFVQHSVTANNNDVEGLPVSILEAMASSIPVVSTRHSGIPEAVLDGKSGYLVDEGDILQMANRMRDLLSSNEKARQMGACGRSIVQTKFSSTQMAKRLQSLMHLDKE